MKLYNIKTLIIILIGILVTSGLYSQSKPMSLKDCISYAIANQSTIKNANLDVNIAHQKVRELTGIGLPQLNGDFTFNDYLSIPTSLIPAQFFGGRPGEYAAVKFGVQYNGSASVSASQLIFDGSYLVGLRASKVYEELSRKSVKRTEIDAVEAVTKAYYMALINQQRLKLFDENIIRLENTFKNTQGYLKAGFAEKIDADRLEVALNNLKTEKEKTTKSIEVGILLLKFQMGMKVNEAITLTDSISKQDLISSDTAQGNAKNRIEYSILQSAKRLNQLDEKRYKAQYLPSLAAFGTYTAQAQRNEFNFFDAKPWYRIFIVGAKLTIPIFDGFQKDARIRQANLAVQKNDNDLFAFENTVNFQTQSALISYDNSFKTLDIQERNLKLAKEVVKVSSSKLKNGVGSNLELTTAESQLREAQINYYDALYNAIVAKIDLQKAKGTLHQ